MTADSEIDNLASHYSQNFGTPTKETTFQQEARRIMILEFEHVFKNCRVYLTFGACLLKGIQSELLVATEEPISEMPKLLANVVFFASDEGIPVTRGTNISGVRRIAPSIWARYEKSSVYITTTNALPETAVTIKLGERLVRIWYAMLISPAEERFRLERGAKEFEERMELARIDPFKLNRASAL
jgi:hypothetical protein